MGGEEDEIWEGGEKEGEEEGEEIGSWVGDEPLNGGEEKWKEKKEKKEEEEGLNWNVKLVMLFTGTNIAAWSICQNQLLSSYLYLLTNKSASFVGTQAAVTGLAQMVTAIPAGHFGDKYRRDFVFKIAFFVGVISIILSFFGFLYVKPLADPCDGFSSGQISEFATRDDEISTGCITPEFTFGECFSSSCVILLVMSFFWGVWNGVNNPTVESIFADSVVTGNRAFIYTLKFICLRCGQSFGPLLSCLFLYILGNEWEISILRRVLVSGVFLWIIPVIITLFFSDDKALGKESEGSVNVINKDEEKKNLVDDDEIELKEFTSELTERKEEEWGEKEEEGGREEEEGEGQGEGAWCWFHPSSIHFIPLMLCSSDFINSFAAGMTVKFFPLFFQYVTHMSPLAISFIYFLTPLAVALGSVVLEALSRRIGRVPSIFISRFLGATFLIFMTMTEIPWLVAGLYIFRTSFMRCPLALVASVLMDVVQKSHRGKWNSVESFTTFSFLGSAMLGGFLIDEHGYGTTLVVTAGIQFLSLLPYVALMRYFSD